MTKTSKTSNSTVLPPLGGDISQYNADVSDTFAALRPGNRLEEVQVREIANISWELSRLRTCKYAYIGRSAESEATSAFYGTTSDFLKQLEPYVGKSREERERAAADPQTVIAAMSRATAPPKRGQLLRVADAIVENETAIRLFDELIEKAERIRARFLRELDRQRASQLRHEYMRLEIRRLTARLDAVREDE